MSRLRHFLAMMFVSAVLTFAVAAHADEGAQKYVETQQKGIIALLKEAPTPARDAKIATTLDAMIDYDELVRRSFGQPCPPQIPSCTNHWKELTDAQKTEVRELVHKLVAKNYRKNLVKVMEFDISYKGFKDTNGDTRVKTEAKNHLKPREPAVQVDYIVTGSGGSYKTVDIYTENSSLAKNYYDQFHKMLITPGQGYPYIVTKLNEKIAKI